jgi:hypothetical protein
MNNYCEEGKATDLPKLQIDCLSILFQSFSQNDFNGILIFIEEFLDLSKRLYSKWENKEINTLHTKLNKMMLIFNRRIIYQKVKSLLKWKRYTREKAAYFEENYDKTKKEMYLKSRGAEMVENQIESWSKPKYATENDYKHSDRSSLQKSQFESKSSLHERLFQEGKEKLIAKERVKTLKKKVDLIGCTFKPNISNFEFDLERAEKENYNKPIHERLQVKSKSRERMLLEMKSDNDELKFCTFQPALRQDPKCFKGREYSPNPKVPNEVFNRLHNNSKLKEQIKLINEKRREEKELTNCTFSPNIKSSKYKISSEEMEIISKMYSTPAINKTSSHFPTSPESFGSKLTNNLQKQTPGSTKHSTFRNSEMRSNSSNASPICTISRNRFNSTSSNTHTPDVSNSRNSSRSNNAKKQQLKNTIDRLYFDKANIRRKVLYQTLSSNNNQPPRKSFHPVLSNRKSPNNKSVKREQGNFAY